MAEFFNRFDCTGICQAGDLFMPRRNLKLLKFPQFDPIQGRIDALREDLEKSNDDWGYELIKLCADYLSAYEPAEHIDDCEICVRHALYHWINYCLENNLDIPSPEK